MNIAVVQENKSELWRRYRAAFEEFARAADYVQSLKQGANPSAAAIEQALLDRERAYAHYERCRDELAAAILPDLSKRIILGQNFSPPHENVERVKEIAESIWELENRPEGKADDDWFRAESILRRVMEARAATAV